jgi:hypothetical protein
LYFFTGCGLRHRRSRPGAAGAAPQQLNPVPIAIALHNFWHARRPTPPRAHRLSQRPRWRGPCGKVQTFAQTVLPLKNAALLIFITGQEIAGVVPGLPAAPFR